MAAPLNASTGRGAPGSLQRLIWPRRAPPAARGFKCLSTSVPPLSRSGPGGGGGLDPFLRDVFPHPPKAPGRSGSRFLFLWGRGSAPALRRLSLVCAGWSGGRSTGASRGAVTDYALVAGGCRSARPRGSAAAWQPGTTPHFVLLFRFICAPFSFLSPPIKGKPNKRVFLFLFRACKVEDI